jgi:L-threonylcarbamoyladenylate synthase
VPYHALALDLLHAFGGGIAAPSANRFGRLSPTSAAHVRAELGDEVDLILDGGACKVGIESTIVDVSRGAPEVLRPGHITTVMLSEVLGETVSAQVADEGRPRAPGTLEAHYAPLTPLELLHREALLERLASAPRGTRLAALIIADEAIEPAPGGPEHLVTHLPADPEKAARALYATLRRLDTAGVVRILVERPPDDDRWAGVRDRLRRAAASFR